MQAPDKLEWGHSWLGSYKQDALDTSAIELAVTATAGSQRIGSPPLRCLAVMDEKPVFQLPPMAVDQPL